MNFSHVFSRFEKRVVTNSLNTLFINKYNKTKFKTKWGRVFLKKYLCYHKTLKKHCLNRLDSVLEYLLS